MAEELGQKIQRREARAAVVGLGYVGLPLLVELAGAGFAASGVDIDQGRIDDLRRGRSHIPDVPSDAVAALLRNGAAEFTSDFDRLRDVDTIDICVPTPLQKSGDPDLSFIVAATDEIARRLRRGQLVILESTTYPGTTEELVLPKLEGTGLKVGHDFFLAFSPERVDPGNRVYTTANIPKVVGGVTPRCRELAAALYGAVIERIVPVSSPRTAEMVKLLENTFRSVNIALANELALLCDRMEIDVWEVIEAASTKPFGFMPFYPGPGLGGHCIPIDPVHLSWKARMSGREAQLIDLAAQVNRSMPQHVLAKITRALNRQRKPLRGARILLLGVAYKENVRDLRESPALDVLELLQDQGAEVAYHDPLVPEFSLGQCTHASAPLSAELLRSRDLVVVTTAHSTVDYDLVVREAVAIVDARNALKGHKDPKIMRI